MKTMITLTFLLILCQFGYGQENIEIQDSYAYKNVLKLSPVELARAEFQVGYERYFKGRSQSMLLMPSIFISQDGDEKKDGFQLMVQYRFYLSQLHQKTSKTLNMFNVGFYSAPYVLGLIHNEVYEYGIYDPINLEYVTDLMEEKTESIEGGALMGIQLDITKRIVFDFFVGGGIRRSNVIRNMPEEGYNSYGILDIGYTGVKPRIGMQMGITF